MLARAPPGSSSIPPTASSAPATWCGLRWRAIRARPFRCTALIWARPMRSSAWMSASTWSLWTRERRRNMLIKVGFEITYAAVQPTPMVIMLSIHPSRYSDIVGTESIVAEPNAPIAFYRDSFGNVCGRLLAPAGGVTLRGSALVRDSGLPDVVVPAAQQIPIDQLSGKRQSAPAAPAAQQRIPNPASPERGSSVAAEPAAASGAIRFPDLVLAQTTGSSTGVFRVSEADAAAPRTAVPDGRAAGLEPFSTISIVPPTTGADQPDRKS